MHRWTKYAKKGFYIEKQGSEKESLKTHAARASRKATSVALKCSVSKELLKVYEEAIDKLDLEADNFISKMQEQSNEAPLVSANCATDTLKGTISFRIPEVIKGAKKKRGTISLEKTNGKKKKKKTAKNKGIDSTNCSIFPLYACKVNFIYFTVGDNAKNAANGSYEGASADQFTVRHLT